MKLKIERNISFPEAKKIVLQEKANASRNYSSAVTGSLAAGAKSVSTSTETKSVACQTRYSWLNEKSYMPKDVWTREEKEELNCPIDNPFPRSGPAALHPYPENLTQQSASTSGTVKNPQNNNKVKNSQNSSSQSSDWKKPNHKKRSQSNRLKKAEQDLINVSNQFENLMDYDSSLEDNPPSSSGKAQSSSSYVGQKSSSDDVEMSTSLEDKSVSSEGTGRKSRNQSPKSASSGGTNRHSKSRSPKKAIKINR